MQVNCSETQAGTLTQGVPALRVSNLHVSWDSTLVLHGVTFEVAPGEILAITGANGSGKSTLIRALLGNAPITGGTVELFGGQLGPRTIPWHRIGYVPQRIAAGGAIEATCLEVTSSGLLGPRKWWLNRHDRERAMETLRTVGMMHKANAAFRHLSGGQKQRVLIARALVRNPDLLIMDEPMAGIDAVSRRKLAEIVADVKAQGKSAVIILHELGELGPHLDRELHLASGHIEYEGLPHLDDDHPAHRHGHHHPEVEL